MRTERLCSLRIAGEFFRVVHTGSESEIVIYEDHMDPVFMS